MKKEKLFSTGELFGVILIGLLSLIMGGPAVLPLAILTGALVGLNVPAEKSGVPRAALIGLLAAGVVVALSWAHNNYVVQLPRQPAIPAWTNTLPVYLLSLGLGVASAVYIAFFRASPNERTRKIALLGFLAVCAIVFPFYDQRYELLWASAVVASLIYMLQALGLNIVAGYAGLLDLGYVAFFAIGGYTAAFLMAPNDAWNGNLKWSFWIVIWVAAAAAAIFGLILGAPTLPLRGDYLAIVTLGFGEIIPVIFKNLEAVVLYEPISRLLAMFQGDFNGGTCIVGCDKPLNITNGTQGLNPIEPPRLFAFISDGLKSLTGYDFIFKSDNYIPWYFLILAMLVLSAFFIGRMRQSRIGRAFVAMREDELAASAMGIPIVKTKLTAFMIGALFSGFAGAFYASYVSFISPDAFDFSVSVIVLCMVILGGTGSITGVILGGLIIKLVDLLLLDKVQGVVSGVLQATVFNNVQNEGVNLFLESILDMTQYKLMLFGLILVVMMLVRPQGLVPEAMTKSRGRS